MGPLGEIGGRELPVLVRIVDPRQEPPPLLVLGDVEEELENLGAVPVKVPLEGVDVLVALLPHPLALRRIRR